MPTASPIAGVFGHAVGRSVTVADRRDVELVDIVDGDRERTGLEAAVGAGGPYRDRAAGTVGFAINRARDSDHTGVRIDGKTAAIVVVQRVADRIAPSASSEKAVTPTAVRRGILATASATASLSLIAVAPDSLTSVTLIV